MSEQELKIKDGYKWFEDQKTKDGKPKYIFDKVEDIPDDFNIEDGIKEFENSLEEINLLKDIDMNNEIENRKTSFENIDSYDNNTIKIYIYRDIYTNFINSRRNYQEDKNLIILYFNYVIYYFNSYLYLKQLQHEEKKKKTMSQN